jgi:YD repeat-containing protein
MRTVNYTANALNQYTQRSYPGYVEVTGTAGSGDEVTVEGYNPVWQGDSFWQELGFNTVLGAVSNTVDIWDISGSSTNYTGVGVLLPKNPETLTYDLDGNLTQDSQWSYTWNAENKLIHMQNGSGMTLDFVYDMQGRRISKVVTVSGVVTSSKKLYYDGWNVIGEVDTATGIGIAYNWGLDLSQSLQGAGGVGGLISMTVSGSRATDGTYTYQYDGNGNVIGLVDMGGNLAAQYGRNRHPSTNLLSP